MGNLTGLHSSSISFLNTNSKASMSQDVGMVAKMEKERVRRRELPDGEPVPIQGGSQNRNIGIRNEEK
jgi:hypothetical protein